MKVRGPARRQSRKWLRSSLPALLWMVSLLAPAQNAAPARQDRIVALFQQARQAEQRREFSEAARLYDKILALDPKIAEVWTNKGLALYELSKHREALTAFAKAAALKPRLLTPHLFLGIIYLKLGEPEKAIGPLESALRLEPRHPQATYELANARARLEQFEPATRLYRSLLEHDPRMEQAWYRLGIAYLNWNKSATRKLLDSHTPSPYGKLLLAELQAVGGILLDAEANYRAVVAAMPGSVAAHLALGRFYLDFSAAPERIRQAQEQFARAEFLAGAHDLQVELALVRLALAQGNFSEACSHLANVLVADLPFARKQLSELMVGLSPAALRETVAGLRAPRLVSAEDSTLSAAAALRYAALLELGELEEAKKNWQAFEESAKRIEATPVPANVRSYSRRLRALQEAGRSRALSLGEHAELAECAWNLGDYGLALRDLLEILKKSPSDRALYWLSLTCRRLAREAFMEALKVNPDSYRAHLLLADLANDRHDNAGALAEYEKAVELGAGDPEVHLLFVQYLTSKGQEAQALACAQLALEKFPSHPALHNELGKLLLRGRNAQEAARHFQQALDADRSLTSARAGLADAYAALGETDRAIAEMRQALGADPDGSMHYRLGRWYQKSGQTREAAEAFAVSTRLKAEKLKRDTERFTALQPAD